MLNALLHNSWVLAFFVIPAALAAVPKLLRTLETKALLALINQGGPAEQKAIRATIAVWVQWAEEKYGAGEGPAKYAAVDRLLARALPFLSSEQRQKLIEDSVAQLEAGAQDAAKPPSA